MSKPIHLGQLQTFVHVVKHGSFSAAAQRLGITQPAVSLQIRQLEKRLGTSLVERVGRRARPTAAGGELLVHAEQIDAVVAAAMDAVMRRATGALGRVRLGTGATACSPYTIQYVMVLRGNCGNPSSCNRATPLAQTSSPITNKTIPSRTATRLGRVRAVTRCVQPKYRNGNRITTPTTRCSRNIHRANCVW